MKFLKILALNIIVLLNFYNNAFASHSEKICVKNLQELTAEEISCDITISNTGKNTYSLFKLISGLQIEKMKLSIVKLNEKDHIKFELISEKPTVEVNPHVIINPATGHIAEDTTPIFSDAAYYVRLLLKKSNLKLMKDPNSCEEAMIFCPLGAATSLTIILAPIAIYGCAELATKCLQQNN
ncbi:MAG: hypothetical protein AABY64_10405 [Bdellovibrionota bacterium]